jgi:hypothetical protein
MHKQADCTVKQLQYPPAKGIEVYEFRTDTPINVAQYKIKCFLFLTI